MSITLVKVTKANINKLLKLKVSKEQNKYVSPIKDIIKEGKNTTEKYNNKPITYWLRAIKYKGYHVGIILLRFNTKPYIYKPPNYQPGVFLNKLMVATNIPELKNTQGLGIGKYAVLEAIKYAKSLGYKKLYTSYVIGEHSPAGFYKKIGFNETGHKIWGEQELVLNL